MLPSNIVVGSVENPARILGRQMMEMRSKGICKFIDVAHAFSKNINARRHDSQIARKLIVTGFTLQFFNAIPLRGLGAVHLPVRQHRNILYIFL